MAAVARHQPQAASRDYCVVYRGRVAVRPSRSLTSPLVATQKHGDVLRVAAVYGKWVRLEQEECARLKVPEAWMLTDGREQGFGLLLEPISERGAAARSAAVTMPQKAAAAQSDWVLSVGVEDEFEECIELHWRLEAVVGVKKDSPPSLRKVVIKMVIDHSQPGTKAPTRPPKDAMVKTVPCDDGKDEVQLVMPSGRRFLVCVTGSLPDGTAVRSAWTQAKTLSERTRAKGSNNLDPVGKCRLACLVCSCTGYVMTTWSANSRNRGRCRRCGCGFENHEVGSAALLRPDALQEQLELFRRENPGVEVTPLPDEASLWSREEVDMWLRTEGSFNPKRSAGQNKVPKPEGNSRDAGLPGRVSVVVPTTESRQSFHTSLWACFEAQTWPDRELVVVETYTGSASPFLAGRAKKDPRLTFLAFKVPAGRDWSIGLKRNICSQLASGEFLAHFDDDDLYAPAYLATLLGAFTGPRVQGVKLASWFIYDRERGVFAHCDPLDCGKQQGKDETDEWTRKWLYGYGFSYVYRRQAAMDNPYNDLNLGEDFEFFSQLQKSKGNESVVLLPDDAGICLHLQHGGNTSDTQHLADRLPSREEVLDLEVADLRWAFDEYMRRLPKTRSMAVKAEPVDKARRRLRSLAIRCGQDRAAVECPTGATAAEVLRCLEERFGLLPVRSELFRVPPSGEAPEPERLRRAAALAQLEPGQLARVQEAPSLDALEAEVAEPLRRVMARVPLHERVGARTEQLWLRLPLVGPDGRSSEFVRVTTTQEKPFPKSLGRTFHVCLEGGTTVAQFREALQPALPATASVSVLKTPEGSEGPATWVDLEDSDFVPEKVQVSAFQAPITPEMILRYGQCLEIYMRMTEMAKLPESQVVLDKLEADASGDEKVYTALLLQFLCEKLYPALAPVFGLPDGNDFIQAFVRAITVHMNTDFDLHMHRAWLEMEMVLRNAAQIRVASTWLEAGGVWNLGGTHKLLQ